MERKIHYCKQCGREINFDGICNLCCVKNEQASASPQDEIDEIKWYNRNIALSQDEIDMLVQKICEEIEETGELDEQHEMFTELVNFREIDTTEIARTAFGKRLFYPSTLYVNAPDDIIHEMIELLRQDNAKTTLEVSHLLECLAVHGGEEVFRAFVEFEKIRRSGRKSYMSSLPFMPLAKRYISSLPSMPPTAAGRSTKREIL